jgi:hypothetical protein
MYLFKGVQNCNIDLHNGCTFYDNTEVCFYNTDTKQVEHFRLIDKSEDFYEKNVLGLVFNKDYSKFYTGVYTLQDWKALDYIDNVKDYILWSSRIDFDVPMNVNSIVRKTSSGEERTFVFKNVKHYNDLIMRRKNNKFQFAKLKQEEDTYFWDDYTVKAYNKGATVLIEHTLTHQRYVCPIFSLVKSTFKMYQQDMSCDKLYLNFLYTSDAIYGYSNVHCIEVDLNKDFSKFFMKVRMMEA